jgi:hypothetical protein
MNKAQEHNFIYGFSVVLAWSGNLLLALASRVIFVSGPVGLHDLPFCPMTHSTDFIHNTASNSSSTIV